MKFQRPHLKRPKLRAPKLKGPQVKTPQFVTDLFSDLRDRHLLIPVVALLAALVAVPLLLKSTSEHTPPAPPAGDSALDGAATQPAVLAENVTVRDYRERLDELKSKNPFRERFTSPAQVSGEIPGLQDTSPTGSPTDTTGSLTGTTSDPGTSTGTGTTTPSSGDSGGGNSTPPPTHTTTWFTWRIDVTVGAQGSERERNGVSRLTFLPSNAKPVVAFLGATESGNKAAFAVSTDVSSTSGDGSCVPSASTCQYVILREGEARTFDYAPDGKTYRLKLRDIRAVKLDKAPALKTP